MSDFFIFGLPRSRTAWLCNLFNTDQVMAFHELMPLYTQEELRGLFDRMREGFGMRHVGVCEPSPMKSLGIRQIFPKAPIVLIERDLDDALKSLDKAFNLRGVPKITEEFKRYMGVNKEAMERLKCLKGVKTVPYTDLEQIEVIRDVWEFCAPDVPFNAVRASLLQGFKVVVGYTDINAVLSHIADQKSIVKKIMS